MLLSFACHLIHICETFSTIFSENRHGETASHFRRGVRGGCLKALVSLITKLIKKKKTDSVIKHVMFTLQDISLDDLREELPERQPRYPYLFKR